MEEEDVKMDDGIKDRKFIVFESQLMILFHRCHSSGLEVKLETSIVGTLLVVNGICPDGHLLHWQSQFCIVLVLSLCLWQKCRSFALRMAVIIISQVLLRIQVFIACH